MALSEDWKLPTDYSAPKAMLGRYNKGVDTATATQSAPTAYQDGSSDSDFLERVYQNETGRASDAWGKEYWQNELSSGKSREDVISAFGNTAEGVGYDNPTQAVEPAPRELIGAQATGYEPTGYTAASKANVSSMTAPDRAGVDKYGATEYTPDTDALAAYQLNKITSKDSLLMQQAGHQGEVQAHRRGLLDTSMAAGASQAEMIKAAAPLAMQDSNTVATAGRDFANAQNRASEFGSGAENTASLSENLQLAEASKFNAASENMADNNFTASLNRAAEFTSSAINRAGEFYANAQNSASIQNANNELSLALQDARDNISTYQTDAQRSTALDQIAYNLIDMGLSNGVFNNPEAMLGFFDTVSGIIPSLGIQVMTEYADTFSGEIA